MVIEVALSLSIVATVLSVFATLLALGTASRLQRRLVRSSQIGGVNVGEEIPGDVLARLFPGELRSQLVSGPTLVAFISSSCRACELMLDQLNHSFDGLSIQAVMVEPAALQSLRGRARFEALWVSDDQTGSIQAEFGSQVTPHAFVLEKGKVARQQAGSDISLLLALVRARPLTKQVALAK
jgi:hypothetical protein